MRTVRFWNKLNQLRSIPKDWIVKSFKGIWIMKTKGPKQDRQNLTSLPMSEGRVP